jgi:hypothetical protein
MRRAVVFVSSREPAETGGTAEVPLLGKTPGLYRVVDAGGSSVCRDASGEIRVTFCCYTRTCFQTTS